MANIATINDRIYRDEDFTPAEYAIRFQELIGDIWEHASEKTFVFSQGMQTIDNFAKTFIIRNKSSALPNFSPGQHVLICPTTQKGVTPDFRNNYIVGRVTAVNQSSLTIQPIYSRGSGTYGTWSISILGADITNLLDATVLLGSTGASTPDSARDAIGCPTVQQALSGLYDDFCGYVEEELPGRVWRSEHFYISTKYEPLDLVYLATSKDPYTGGQLILDAQQRYAGDNRVFNGPPDPMHSDWSCRPGVIGLSSSAGDSKVTITRLPSVWFNASGSITEQFTPHMVFPTTSLGDFIEFSFMIPVGEEFSEQNDAGFCIGTVSATSSGPKFLFAIGSAHAALASRVLLNSPFASSPALEGAGPGKVSVIREKSDSITPGFSVYTDDPATGVSNRTWSPTPGKWYKVRLDGGKCDIFLDNIRQWRIAYPGAASDPLTPQHFVAGLYKRSGNRPSTILLDYIRHFHRREEQGGGSAPSPPGGGTVIS